jgi:cobalamin biosynthesis protein CobT
MYNKTYMAEAQQHLTGEPTLAFQTPSGEHNKQAKLLEQFPPADQQTILYRQRVLSSLAHFVGKDFQMPVTLGMATPQNPSGWQWDFIKNEIQVNTEHLLTMPMERLRFLISHEGSHRRISRITEVVPLEEWKQPGFSFMTNAIEDPRVNSFLAEAYPKSKDSIDSMYTWDLGLDATEEVLKKAKAQLGYQPRFIQAGKEYIRQWYLETKNGTPAELDEDLPEDVKQVVQATLSSARDSWLHYPSRQEADQSEDLIQQYARVSYSINRDHVWPEFKKLVDEDQKDQRAQELLKQMSKEGQDEEQQGEGQGLMGQLTPEQQQELSEAIKKAIQQPDKKGSEESGNTVVVDLDELSPELKKKIQEYIDSLPEDVRKKLEKQAKEALEQFEDELNEELAGKLTGTPGKTSDKPAKPQKPKRKSGDQQDDHTETAHDWQPPETSEDLREFKDIIEKAISKDENVYERTRREVLPIIDELEQDLREIFVARRATTFETGFKTGKKIDIKRRIQEKAKGISAVESHAWQRRELPREKDYAITLLVDLSGSMQGQKIAETFKGAVVLAEVLNRLSIQTEILGFNDRIYEYQGYGENMGRDVRQRMGGMLDEVSGSAARWNDDGWALEESSKRLASQKAKEKFLLVLSDGQPEPSRAHAGAAFELQRVVARIMKETDQKLIGLGIGPGTNHVETYYPNSVANINVRQMPERVADIIREAIANFDTF